MSARAFTLLLGISLAFTLGPMTEPVAATDSEPGCCICLCGASGNSTTFGNGNSGAVCSDVANSRECSGICGDLGCPTDFAGHLACTDPALAEACGIATMAPASSPTGLIALAAVLAGFGAFYLRRRSLRS